MRDFLHRSAIRACIPLLLLVNSGCNQINAATSRTGALSMWATGPMERVVVGEALAPENAYFSKSGNQITLTGAVNEVVDFQMLLGCERIATAVSIECGPLTGPDATLPPSGFAAYLQQPVVVAPLPSWYVRRNGPAARTEAPDVLIPLNSPSLGGRVRVIPERPALLWGEYAIPRQATPGEYHGNLVLRAEGSQTTNIGLVVKVRSCAIPDARHLTILAGLDAPLVAAAHLPAGTDPSAALHGLLGDAMRVRAMDVTRDACQLLHAHRLNPYLTGFYPHMSFGANGAVELDWTRYDELASSLIDGTAYPDHEPASLWPVPADRSHPSPERLEGIESPWYAAVLRQYLAACADHFAQRGWKSSACVDLAQRWPDGPIGYLDTIPVRPAPRDYDVAALLGRITDLADRNLAYFVTLFPTAMTAYGWPNQAFTDLRDVADIWAPPARFFDVKRLSQARQLGQRIFFTPDDPAFGGSMSIESSAADTRSTAYHAFLLDSGIWLPRAAHWPAGLSVAANIPPYVSREWLIYPGGLAGLDRCLPSVRLKRLLRGAQDYEYLWLLRQNGREATAKLIAESLVKASGTDAYLDQYADEATHDCVLDPEYWELARRLMGDEIEAAPGGPQVATSDPAEQRLTWDRFLKSTRPVIAWSEGCRCSIVRHTDSVTVLAEFRVALENQRTQPVSGTLSLGELPEGWTPVADKIQFGPLPPGRRGRYNLSVRITRWPVTLSGHIEHQIAMQVAGDPPVQIPVVLSVVAASRQAKGIAIDGRLEDWQVSGGNAAADFISIGPAPSVGPQQARPRAGDATMAFVTRDEQNLYLAIRCRGASSERSNRLGGDNQVSYDGLMPTDEDLVEVLIDPTNAGTDSGDLYHLAFKSHGTLWAEKGVGTPRPIGARTSWGTDIQYAILPGERGDWTIEARIPLTAFGGDGRRSGVWGINVTRFTRATGGYWNWSGAQRYCYNPQSLGNMLWGN